MVYFKIYRENTVINFTLEIFPNGIIALFAIMHSGTRNNTECFWIYGRNKILPFIGAITALTDMLFLPICGLSKQELEQ